MPDESKNIRNNSDEINISELFAVIGRGFNRVGNQLLYTVASFRNILFNYKLIFLVCLVIGISLAITYNRTLQKEVYKSTMIMNCSYLNKELLETIFKNLNDLTREKERTALAEELGIEIEAAKNVKEFESKTFVTEEDKVELEVLKEQLNNVEVDKKENVALLLQKLNLSNKNSFLVTAYVYDPAVIKPLEDALVKYFLNNNFIKKRMEINKTTLLTRQKKLINESQKLDSLKKVLFQNFQAMNKTSRGSNNVILGEEKATNPLDVFTQDLKINQDILDIERQLYVDPDFEVVQGFTTSKVPASFSLAELLAISIALSILFGYVVVGFWKFNKLLDKYPTRPVDQL